jgi:2-hydroxychromene-2-carboxylate isomerase
VTPEQPVFYYDLGCADCYLVAERAVSELSVMPEWEPVLGRSLGIDNATPDRAAVQSAAQAAHVQPLRWPESWPPDTELAMLTATYAKRVGRAVAFSLAAFRQAFAGGRDLGDEGTVLIAAAACEMHPTAILKAIRLRSVTEALTAAGERARAAGVTQLPAIEVAGSVFSGPGCLEAAEVALTGATR